MAFTAHPSLWQALEAFGLHINKVKNLRDHQRPISPRSLKLDLRLSFYYSAWYFMTICHKNQMLQH